MTTALAAARSARARPLANLALFWCALTWGCWFLASTWSAALWEGVPLLPLVQFPWRLYGPLALFLGLAGACALTVCTPRAGAVRLVAQLTCLALVLLLGYGALARRPLVLAAPPTRDIDASTLAAKEYNRYGAGTTSGGEFLPRTVHWEVEGTTRRGIRIYEDAFPQAGWQAGLVRVLAGQAAVTGVSVDTYGIVAEVDAGTASQVAFHQLAFPGWRGYVDGQPAQVDVARYEPLAASLGFMVMAVPPGRHRVEVRFGPTPLRSFATALSAASGALAVAWLVTRSRGRLTLVPTLALALLAAGCSVATGAWTSRPMSSPPPDSARIALDVIGMVQRGQANSRSPGGSGSSLSPPFLEARFQAIDRETRRWLYMHPPSAVSVRLRVPSNAYFQAGLALDPQTWHADVGDGVRFLLDAETPSGTRQLMDRHVNPRARGEERGWNDVWIDLGAFAGQDLSLTLRTEHAADTSYDWAGWSNPQVVIYRSARPHPGEKHNW
ncbi:MAG: hypothetical protein AVDCRST_MAG77-1768 [uncultured Chloroflexi bacterium]|uniref:Uncharacterized protein n=1 Tax=uncultured Chloroflexota bacterium TaxID=166587 RepID=A0A6J4I804_9CHLR|nr:MAG: hypothetical protein AVDCRST_MAG77-1768 [uncultured Chloroflexota bacterium]